MRHRIGQGAELVAVGETSLRKALTRVVACQNCSPEVSRPFGSVLSGVLAAEGALVEYVLTTPARCPSCRVSIFENTLVRCDGERDSDFAFNGSEAQAGSESRNVVLIDESVLCDAASFVTACGHCLPTAKTTFDYILDEVTGCDPRVTEYVLSHPATCPRCAQPITEKTIVAA
jgi:hypothetical protein